MDVERHTHDAWRADLDRRRSELDLISRKVAMLARCLALALGVLLIVVAVVLIATSAGGWYLVGVGGLIGAGVTLLHLAALSPSGPDPPQP
jgi:hypothetical protein